MCVCAARGRRDGRDCQCERTMTTAFYVCATKQTDKQATTAPDRMLSGYFAVEDSRDHGVSLDKRKNVQCVTRKIRGTGDSLQTHIYIPEHFQGVMFILVIVAVGGFCRVGALTLPQQKSQGKQDIKLVA